MRVLLVNHRFFPIEGGTERWTLGLALALRKRGVEVTVLTQQEPGAAAEELLQGIQVVRIPMRHVGRFRLPSGYWSTLKRLDFDLLHLSGNRIWCADYYFPVAEIFDGPQVITPHDFYQLAMDPSLLNRIYFKHYLPMRLRAFDAYLADTDREGEMVASFGFPRERVRVALIGIDTDEFAQETPPWGMREKLGISHPVVALYVGGLWENKRVDRLVRALAEVRERVSLVVVGRDIPESRFNQAQITSLAAALGVEVKFAGALERQKVIAAYKESDMYLLGSQYEGFGISLVEALAAGLPFVAYDVGAAPLLAQGNAGFVARDDKEFADAVKALATDHVQRRAMSLRAKQASKSWDWDRIVERYLASYQEVLTSRRPASE